MLKDVTGFPSERVKDFGVRTKISGQNALVEHDEILLSERIVGNSRISLNYQ